MKWVLSDSKHCNVEVADWFPSSETKQRLFEKLNSGKTKLLDIKLQKMEAWLSSQ